MPLSCVSYSSGRPSSAFSGEVDLPSRYIDIDQIGQGANCVVVRARDKFLDRQVAIKILKSELTDFNSVRRFQQEAKMMSSFNLKNLPVVLDFGLSAAGRPFMVMELVEGLSLKQTIKELDNQLTVELALEITMQILSALQHAHERGIVHRDLKSQNVMISWTEDGKPLIKVVDFGLAGEINRPMMITECGAALGTPYYMSPEQAQGCSADARSDLYSLGCVMFEMLVGHTPFEKRSAAETLSAHIRETAPALRSSARLKNLNKHALNSLNRLVAKLLEKEPAKRHQCVSDVQDDLELVIEQLQTASAEQSDESDEEQIDNTLAGFTSWTNIRAIQANDSVSMVSTLPFKPAKTGEPISSRFEILSRHVKSSRGVQLTLILLVMALTTLSAAGFILPDPVASMSANASMVPTVIPSVIPTNLPTDCLNPVAQLEREAQAQLSDKASDITKKTFKATIGGKFHISDGDLWALPSLADKDLVLMKDFPSVKHINLITSQAVTGEGFHQIKTLPIESLDLRGLTISQSGFDAISEMKTLNTLQIDYMPFLTVSKLTKLQSAPSLKTLTCKGAHLSLRCQSEIARIPHLTHLFLVHASGLSDTSLELFAKVPTLKHLSVSTSSGISDDAIASFKKSRPDVELDLE